MITERIQALIDRHVAGSPRARELLRQLDGRSMQISARYTPWHVTLLASTTQLQLSRSATTADVTLSGSPMALLSLLRESPDDVIRRGDATLVGDAEIASRFQELLQLLRPDLEAGLAQVVGDVPAYGAGSLLRKALDYGRSTVNTQMANAGEYLTHEKRLLVPRTEAAQFLTDVDALREQTDRLAARVAALEAQSAPTPHGAPGSRSAP
jgi:ubiquinone biosynthesis accessory factor UbiJ